MMLLLNKILPLLLLPFGVVCGLVLFALWRKKWWPGLLALAVLYLSSIPLVADFLLGSFENRYSRLPPEAVGPADAAVVLGGVLGYLPPDDQLASWFQSYERFDAGLALLRAGRTPRVVFTGARLPWDGRAITEGDELRRLALFRGVSAESIVVTRKVANTADEAGAVIELARREGWKRIVVVTSAWHMPRAMLLFRRTGIECQPFPVDYRTDRERALMVTDFLPQATAWQRTEMALREGYGWLFYWLFRRGGPAQAP